MTLKKFVVLCGVMAAAMFMPVPTASADDWNKKTEVTIGDTVRVPGAVLQPGSYVFKLADSQSNRHIVQIFNEDESELITTVLAIPNYRLDPADDTVLEFWETPSGSPAALRAWFYPGDNFGQEFRYPADEAAALSASTNQEVPALSEEEMAALSESQKSSEPEASIAQERESAEQPLESEQSEVTTAEVQPAQELPRAEPETEQAQPQPEPAPQPQEEAAAPETEGFQGRELPQTAGYLPLVGLSGLLAVGAATLVRFGRER